jgi:hypothetical protein
MELFAVIGAVLLLTATVWIVIKAFRVSPAWGVACFLLPFVILFFALLHWRDTKAQLLMYLAGWGLIVLPHLFKG